MTTSRIGLRIWIRRSYQNFLSSMLQKTKVAVALHARCSLYKVSCCSRNLCSFIMTENGIIYFVNYSTVNTLFTNKVQWKQQKFKLNFKNMTKNKMLITKAIHTFRKLFRSLLQQVKKHCFVFFMLVCNENVKTFIRFE